MASGSEPGMFFDWGRILPGGTLLYTNYIGMCSCKEYAFQVV